MYPTRPADYGHVLFEFCLQHLPPGVVSCGGAVSVRRVLYFRTSVGQTSLRYCLYHSEANRKYPLYPVPSSQCLDDTCYTPNIEISMFLIFDVSERSIGYPTLSMAPGGIDLKNPCAPFLLSQRLYGTFLKYISNVSFFFLGFDMSKTSIRYRRLSNVYMHKVGFISKSLTLFICPGTRHICGTDVAGTIYLVSKVRSL